MAAIGSVGKAEAEAPRRLTVEAFEALHRAARWAEGERLELIGGVARPTSPINDPHIACVDRLNWHFSRRFGDDVIVHVQNPVRLDRYNQPQPDVAVLRFRPDFYRARKAPAEDARLLVEVADSSLGDDLSTKRDLYARAGIGEYWVLDVNGGVAYVHRSPDRATGRYLQVVRVSRGEELAAQFAPRVVFPVADLLG